MIPKVCRDQVHYEPQNQCAPPVQCTARVRELLGMIDSPKRLDCDRKCGEFGLSLGISCEKKRKEIFTPSNNSITHYVHLEFGYKQESFDAGLIATEASKHRNPDEIGTPPSQRRLCSGRLKM